ncbi:MAG: TraC family protein, partial [Deltaproteobacteria bacterium]|nr:TraC family protein [Deltaproteobacteria bacterium]
MSGVLEAVKSIFFGERLEPADAVPRNILRQLSSIPRLTGILPYMGWIDDERLLVLDQGAFGEKPSKALGFCIETMPQTGANEEMERVLASLFMSCPTGTGIQISLYGSPHILPLLKRQANMLPVDADKINADWGNKRNRNIYRVLARRRIDHYLKGTAYSLFSHQTYLLRDFRCVISVTLPLDPDNNSDREEAIRVRESVHATLRSAHLPGTDWGPEDLLNFVGDFFDHDRVFGKGAEKPIEYDRSRPMRASLSNLEIASATADSYIKFRKAGGAETALQTFSVRQYPRYFRLGNMGAMIGDAFQMALSIPCPFMITIGAISLDYESARTKAQMKSARATQAAGSQMARFQPDLQDRKRDWDMVLR